MLHASTLPTVAPRRDPTDAARDDNDSKDNAYLESHCNISSKRAFHLGVVADHLSYVKRRKTSITVTVHLGVFDR